MTFTKEQIEWVVVEVIRRLGLVSASVDGEERSFSSVGGDLAIAERLVTLRSIEGRLAGVKRLVVKSRAVITPAVRDELKQRQIELVREVR